MRLRITFSNAKLLLEVISPLVISLDNKSRKNQINTRKKNRFKIAVFRKLNEILKRLTFDKVHTRFPKDFFSHHPATKLYTNNVIFYLLQLTSWVWYYFIQQSIWNSGHKKNLVHMQPINPITKTSQSK